MVKKIVILIVLIFAVCLGPSACAPAHLQTSTEIEAALTDSSFQPSKWWVPAGENVTLLLNNQGEAPHDWTLLARPLSGTFDENDRQNVFFQVKLQPGESTTVTFQTPAMPGEYDVISALPGDVDDGLVGRFITIEP